LVELGGTAAPLLTETRTKLDAVLPPTWSKANPVDIGGDADATRYVAALDVLLADPANDAVLVMNVETAVAPSGDIARAIAERIKDDRARKGSSSKLVLSAWVGNERLAVPIFEQAAIPRVPTEDDAVRAFMQLVKHREAINLLMATPPNVSSLFTPDRGCLRPIATFRRCRRTPCR
jgi:acetyltransferase